jgi:hypothetical protein
MTGAPKIYNKDDLAKLKDSHPVQITAHAHEVIVPVVYSRMVKEFLEKKGVKLPLTHHQLAEMKHEAGVSGYAKGTFDLRKSKKAHVQHQHQHVSQKVVINLPAKKKRTKRTKRVVKAPSESYSIPPSRQTPFESLQGGYHPHIMREYIVQTIDPNLRYDQEKRLQHEQEKSALERHKKAAEEKYNDVLQKHEQLKKEHAKDRETLEEYLNRPEPVEQPEQPVSSSEPGKYITVIELRKRIKESGYTGTISQWRRDKLLELAKSLGLI